MESKREIVIMVDDDIANLTVVKNNLSEKYDVFTAPSGRNLFQVLEKVTPALILLDIEMPEMDGYEVIKKLKSTVKTAHFPVIFLTTKIDPENEAIGLNLGAVDYITKPFSKELLLKRIDLHIAFEKQKKELMRYNLKLEEEVDKKTQTVLELQNAMLRTVSELVECRENITWGHIERTQHYLSLLVDFMLEHGVYTEELSSWDIKLFILSSQLHDVGKISIKDSILMKPGKLTEEEFEEIKKHTVFGVDIIRKIEENTTGNSFLQYAEILACSHHERWDGAGYPYGLKGNEIPLQGRIMALVDVYDKLTNDRSYKKAVTHEKAVEIIKDEKGKHFDPLISEVFLKNNKEFKNTVIDKNYFVRAYTDPGSANNLRSAIKVVARIVDIRGGMEGSRVERMRRYIEIFLKAMMKYKNYKKTIMSWDIDLFLMSAQLHDIGKIAVADQLLKKTEKLTDAEYEKIKTHANLGIRIVQQLKENVENETLLNHAEALAGCHHEKWDGTGYPLGLKGEHIPLQGRIMAIVDVYEALTTDRPHRKKKTHGEAVEIIRSGTGTRFDPELIEVFLESEKKFEKVG